MTRGRTAAIVTVLVATIGLLAAASASAAWNAGAGSGQAYSKARSLNGVAAPSVSVTGRQVAVSWTAPGGPVPATGYEVKRYDTSNNLQSIGASCSGTVSGVTCTETATPPGNWKYTVTSRRANWRGTESPQSSTANVGAPTLSLTSTVNSFPTVLTGNVTGYIAGANVIFRLDDPNTGTVLTGSTTPSSIPANGSATVSVTIPAGTSNGSHTVYAIGSGGDQASAPITVNAPKVTGSVIGKSAGGRVGRIRQGGTYRIFANVSGSGGPPAGLASLTADVSTVTTGQTAVPMTFGSYTAGGQSYNYRSAILTANGTLSEGTKAYTTRLTDSGGTITTDNFSVVVDNTRPIGSDVQTTNVSGGTVGRAELGDTITVTYGEQMEEISVLAGWTGSSTNVVLRLNNAGGGDNVQIWNATNTAQLPLGQVNLARTDYVTTSRTFGATGTPSTMVMSGNSVTVTLGTPSGAVGTAAAASAMVWTPSATATDIAGNAAQTTNATESGASDLNF